MERIAKVLETPDGLVEWLSSLPGETKFDAASHKDCPLARYASMVTGENIICTFWYLRKGADDIHDDTNRVKVPEWGEIAQRLWLGKYDLTASDALKILGTVLEELKENAKELVKTNA